jgi:rfaE bifunctional protein nucleotidyltransferase chain/domain
MKNVPCPGAGFSRTRLAGHAPAVQARLSEYPAQMYPVPVFESKVCLPGQLAARLGELPRPLVFTNGCFDVLHRGHVTYLAQARALGAALIIGVNSDASVKRQGKGPDRPINSELDRMMVLAALESVSLVIKFDEDTPLNLILACKPDVLVKGGDWTPDRIVGAREVQSWGGAVHSIPFLHQRSTTALLDRIRSL